VNFAVTVVAPGAGTPAGNVEVREGVNVLCTGTVAGGNCTITSGFASIGTKVLTAVYAGDANFNGSSSSTIDHVVNKADTTTTLTPPGTSVTGQAVTVLFSVSVTAPGGGTPTGNVTVSNGSGASCTGTVAAGSCSLTFFTAGSQTLTAVYAGDANYNGSTSSGVSHLVNKADTTTTVNSSSPTVVGQPILVAYSVTAQAPGSGIPAGNVTVSDGAGASCIGTVAAGGCTLTPTYMVIGGHTITATYGGDANYNGSVSSSVAHSVIKANTLASITLATPSPWVVGQNVTIQFQVVAAPPGGGTPTGSVTVDDGIGNTCSGTVAAGSCSMVFLTPGARNLSASYSGDANYNPSTSPIVAETVNKANTTTAITFATAGQWIVGQTISIEFTVTVNAPGAGTPTGNVTISDGASTCTTTVAVGTCSFTLVAAGARTFTATYAGNTNFNGSTSTGYAKDVSKASSITTFSANTPSPAVVGEAVTMTFSVTSTTPTPTPSGTVTVTDGVHSCTGSLVSGTGTCIVNFLTIGTKTLTATFNGDSNFSLSVSGSRSQVVNQASTNIAIIPPAGTVGINRLFKVSFIVGVTAPGGGTPTGNVQVKEGATVLCTGSVASGGCQVLLTTLGNHSLTAAYLGDANYIGSTSSAVDFDAKFQILLPFISK
jgi:large repetitive protein